MMRSFCFYSASTFLFLLCNGTRHTFTGCESRTEHHILSLFSFVLFLCNNSRFDLEGSSSEL